MRILLCTALVILVGCRSQPKDPKPRLPGSQEAAELAAWGPVRGATIITQIEPCQKEADTAAFLKLDPVLGDVDWTSEASVGSAEKSIACYRPWAMTLADPCQREAMQ